jgi:hypothetical protein
MQIHSELFKFEGFLSGYLEPLKTSFISFTSRLISAIPSSDYNIIGTSDVGYSSPKSVASCLLGHGVLDLIG